MTILIHLSRGMAAVSPVIDTDCDLEQLKPSSTVTDSEGGSGVSVCLCVGVVFLLGTERQSHCWGISVQESGRMWQVLGNAAHVRLQQLLVI